MNTCYEHSASVTEGPRAKSLLNVFHKFERGSINLKVHFKLFKQRHEIC